MLLPNGFFLGLCILCILGWPTKGTKKILNDFCFDEESNKKWYVFKCQIDSGIWKKNSRELGKYVFMAKVNRITAKKNVLEMVKLKLYILLLCK